jgi:hypothetical protein
MSDFKRPNKGPSVQQPLREFPTVGDSEDSAETISSHYGSSSNMDYDLTAEEMEGLKRARQEKQAQPVPIQSRTRLEFLADIGKITKDVEIGGITFTLRTLKSKEMKAVYLSLVEVSNKVEELYNHKFYSLAYSLIKLDGQPVEIMLNIRNFLDKLKILQELEESTTDKLYSAYLELKNSSETQFAVKTDADVKEVSDTLKK